MKMNPFQNIERFDLRVLSIKHNYLFKLIMHSLLCIVLGLIFLFSPIRSFGQACDPSTPSFKVDLTGQPGGTWLSPSVVRDGNCCGSSWPDRCIEFWLTLDSASTGINFTIPVGALPSGALYYQIGCGAIYPVGVPICLPGPGPYRITFCKPGNNENIYSIQSIAKPSITDLVTVSDGCTSKIYTSNFILNTITWQSISPGTPGQYNSYLSFPIDKSFAVAKYQTGAPSSVTYQVCGTPVGGCSTSVVCLKSKVNFVTTLGVTINPNNPTICYGGTSTPLTANVTGGTGPYTYTWMRNGVNVGNTKVINASTTGTYTVTVADATSCPTATSSVVVTAFASPITANAGPDQSSCANNPSIKLMGAIQQATGGIWSGGTGVYSPSNTSLSPTYTPTAAEIATGSVTHTLTTTGNGTCPAATDQIILTIAKTPIVSAGPNQMVCANNSNVSLAGSVLYAGGGRWSGGTGTFLPNDSTLDAVYKPTAAEILSGIVNLKLTSIQNGTCLPVSSTMQITITPAPTANAGPDQTVCANNPTLNITGTATNATSTLWSGGFGIYSPNNSSLNLTYTVAPIGIAAGSVTLTLTASKATCIPVSDQMVITITPAPTVDAGSDQTVCANNAIVTLAGSETIATGATWSGGNGTFTPNANSLNASYTPTVTETSNGSVTLTLTSNGNGNCLAVSDQMTITLTPAPTVNAGPDQTVCGNNEITQLAGSVTVASGGIWNGGAGTFSPNKNDLNAHYTPTAAEILAGSVTLTLTSTGNANCLPVSDQMLITITPVPTVNAGPDLSICENNAVAQLNGTVTVAGGGVWAGANGTLIPSNLLVAQYVPTAAEIANGIIHLTLISINNGNCYPVSDNLIINITPSPTVDAGSDQTVCGSSATVSLNGAVTVSAGGQWTSSGTGTFSPSNTDLNATYNPSPADIASASVTLTLTTTGNGNCNVVTDQMVISFSSVPVASAGPDKTACTNDFPIQLEGSGTTGSWVGGTGTFTPSRNSFNPTYVPSASEISAGTITLTFKTNPIGSCPSISDDIAIGIPPGPVVNSGTDLTVCANKTPITLSGSVSNAGGGTWTTNGTGTFTPSPNDVNASYVPSAADTTNGTVTLKLTSTSNGGCTAESDLLVINFTHAPTVGSGSDQTYCADITSIAISGSKTLASGVVWSGGAGTYSPDNTSLNTNYTPTAAEKNSGTLKLILTTTGNGTCNAESDTVVITFSPAPTINAGIDQTICADSSGVSLNGTVTVASGGMWSSSGSGTFSPNAFVLTATYIPSVADTLAKNIQLTLTSTGNGTCIPVNDVMNIYIAPIPIVNAGFDKTFCSDIIGAPLSGTVLHATGGQWSTSGTGTFSPNNSALKGSYIPSAADKSSGSVILTLVSTGNGSCKAVSDQVMLNFTPAPTIDAGPDMTVCASSRSGNLNATVTVATGGVWTTSGTGSFSDPNSLNPTYNATNADTKAGSVTLTITSTGNGTCIPVSDNLILNFDPRPGATAGSNITVCGDVASISLNGSVTNATGGDWTGGSGTFSPNASTLNASYIPTAAERTGSTIPLTLTTTGNGTCAPDNDKMQIIITPPPTIDAGANQTVCADIGSVTISGSVTIATGGQWTTAGSGTFVNANSLTTTYKPSSADISNGSVKLTLTSTGNGTCIPVKDQIIITITPAPTINAGSDVTICAEQVSTTLNGSVTVATGAIWSTSGSGTFSPDNTDLNATYFPSFADTTAHSITLTLTSTGNGSCIPVSDTKIITLQPAPFVDAGLDTTYCSDITSAPLDGTVAHATGGLWSTSGFGSFSPNNTSLNASYVPSAVDKSGGVVILTLTSTGNGLCNAVKNQVVLNFTPAPTINAGSDTTVCAATPPLPLKGAVTVATGGTWTTSGSGTFSDPNSLNPTYTPSAADTSAHSVMLTITSTGNGTCIPVKDTKVITFTPSPIVDAGPGQALCASEKSASLNGSVFNATGGKWTTIGTGTFGNANSLSTTYFPSTADTAAGSVKLILTSTGNGLCVAISDTTTIAFNDLPKISAGFDTLCTNLTGVNLNASVTLASGVNWTSSGTGTFSPSANSLTTKYTPTASDKSKGTIYLYVTATGTGACAPPTDTIRLSVQQDPVVNAGPDQTVCINSPTVALTGTITNASGGTWSTLGGGTFSPAATNLNALYTKSNADTTNKKATLILTSIPNGYCPSVKDTMVITLTPLPLVNAGPNPTICADSSGVTLNSTIKVATGATWTSSGSGNFTPNANTLNAIYKPSPADTAVHSVQLILTTTGNGACIAAKDTVAITITPAPTINVGPYQTVCADANSIPLNGSTTVATGINWTTTGSGSFINGTPLSSQYTISIGDSALAPGKIKFIGTTTGNGTCKAVSDTLVLNITPVPTVTASAPPACADMNSIQLSGSVTVATGAQWTTSGTGIFSPSDVTLNASYIPSAADKAAGTVNLLLTSTGNGTCNPVSAEVTLIIAPAPIVNAGSDTTVCADAGTVNLSGSVLNAGGGIWSTLGPGNFTPSATTLASSYNLSNADTTAHTITLVLTSTGNGVCKAVIDSKVITITPSPVINAGADQLICGNANTFMLNGNVSNAMGGTWTTSGTGTFSNANSLNTGYQFSSADTTAGSVTITLTSTGNGLCKAASDQQVVVITDAPKVSAGGSKTICADASGVNLSGIFTVSSGITWTSSGSGIFTPNANSLNATYVPSAADIAAQSVQLNLTTTGNGLCKSEKDSIIVTITPAPTINVGPDQTVCADANSINLNATTTVATGINWSTSGTGTFSNATSLATQYTLSNADTTSGLVKLIGTTTGNGTCKAVADTITLTITPVPTILASVPTACADSDTIQLSGKVTVASGAIWTTSGTGTFVPNNTTLNAKYITSAADKAAGSVNLLLTSTGNGTCNPVSTSVVLIILPAPIANAGPDKTVCADVGTVSLSGNVTNASGASWSSLGTGSFINNTSLNGAYQLSDADTTAHSVAIVLTTTGNGLCKAVTDTTIITIVPAPVVNAGFDQPVCDDTSSIQVNGTVFNAGGGTWTSSGIGTFFNANSLNPTYQFTPADTTAGTVTLTLTSTGNGTCKPVSDQIVITITDAPMANAGPDQTICADASGVSLNGTVTVASGVVWTSSGSGTFSPNANTLNATYLPSAADIATQNVQLTLTTIGNGTCKPASDQMTITITPAPTINLGPDQTVCADVTAFNLSAAITVASGVNWTSTGTGTFSSASSNSAQYTISSADTTSGTVKFIGTTTGNGTCNAVKDTLFLTITPAPTILASAPTACADSDTIQLSGKVTVASGAIWTTSGSGTFVPNNTTLNAKYVASSSDKAAGTVNLLLTSTGNGTCNPVSTTVKLNILPAPIANAGSDKTICADNGTVSLSGSVINSGGGTWSTLGTGTFAPSVTNLSATYNLSNADTTAHIVTLVLTTTGNGLCNAVTDTMEITIVPAPVVNAGFDQPVCGDAGSIQVNGTVFNAGGGTWTTSGTGTYSNANILNPTYQFTPADTTAGTVTLTLISNGNGTCKAVSDQVIITFTDAPQANAGPDQTICADANGVNLNGSVTVASGVQWTSSGSGTFTPNANTLNATYVPSLTDITAQSVQLTITTVGTGTCKPVSDQMIITITPAPTINVGPDQTVCADATKLNLNASITVASGVNWTTTGSGTFSSASSNPAQYTISNADTTFGTVKFIGITTGNGSCKAVTDTLILTLTPAPTISALAPIACADSDTIQLSGKVTVATGVIWTTSGSGSFVPNNTTLNAKYVASSTDKAAGTVNLLLTSTGNGTCKPVSASVVLNITPAPIANAGSDKTICADNGTVSLSGSVINSGGGTWSTLGTGTFAPTVTNLSATYNLSNADTTTHTVTLVLTTTGNGLCNAVTDTLEITIVPAPVVNAGFDQPVCGDAGSIQVNGTVFNAGGGTWTTSGTGTYSNANILNPTYQFTSSDTTAGTVTLTLTSTGNGTCNAVSDQVVITFTDAPQAHAGPDQTICADSSGVNLNGSVTVASGVLWTSSGSGTFTPNTNALNAIYVPSATDTAAHNVQLTLTTIGTGSCKPVSDQMTVTITPAPTINVGPDATICADLTKFNLNAVTTVASGINWTASGAGYFSNATTLSTVYTIDSDKTIGLIKFVGTTTGNGTCNAVSDTLLLTITTAPTVYAGPDITICSDSSLLQVSGSTTVASGVVWTTNGTGTFVPNTNTLTAYYNPSNSDINNGGVTIALTTTGNGTCLPVSDTLSITLTSPPTVNAGPDQTICANSIGALLNGAVSVATGGSWTSSGSGTFTPNANGLISTYIPSPADTAAKNVTLVLTTTGNGTCKSRKDSIILSIDPLPIVHSGANNSCADKNGVMLNGTVANATGAIWTTTGSGSFTPNATSLNSKYIPSTGDIDGKVVKLTLTSLGNGTCNADSSSFDLVTVFNKPNANAGPDQRICINASTALNGMPIPYATYTWYTLSNTPIGKSINVNVIANSDTSFVYAVTDSSGCVVTDTINVFVVDTVKFQLDPHYCFERGLILDANPQPTIPTLGTFDWYRNDTLLVGENLSTLQVQNIGKHLINYSYGTCTYSDSTVVTPLPSPKGADKYTCPGATTLLSTSPVGVNYQWTINNKLIVQDSNSINVNASITPGESNSYVVTVTDKLGCKNNDTINVIAIPPPDLNLNDASACIGNNVTLTAEPSNINSLQYGLPLQYVWEKDFQYMPDTLSSITVSKAGIYSVRLNIGECYAYDTATVTYHGYPVPNNESNYTYCFDDNGGMLDAGPGYAYNWMNVPAGVPNTNRTVIVNEPGIYYVMISNEFNCSVKDSFYVKEKCAPQLYVAESFTPGIQGGNNMFYIKGIHFANYEIFIYNRWGEMIFHTKDPENSWDGTFRGENMPPGVYPYVITYTGDNDSYTKKYEKQGSVTLIR